MENPRPDKVAVVDEVREKFESSEAAKTATQDPYPSMEVSWSGC